MIGRILTEQEEQAIRLVHHEFAGLTTAQTAKQMNITQRRVQQLLQSAKRKAPQLFPILTFSQQQIRDYICRDGFNFEQIAKKLNISKQTITGIVKTLRKKGVYLTRRKPVAQYQNWMDGKVVQKF